MNEKKQFSYENLSKYRNVLMGLQIILIIIFHFAVDGYYVRDSRIIYLFYKYIRSSGVDIFLLLSGLGLYFSWKKNPDVKQFYIKRYTRVLIPYFLVAVPAWIWLDIFCLNKGWGAFIQDVFFLSFFVEQTRWFWYILMICLCYWVFPYIFRVIESAVDKTSAQLRVLVLCGTSTLVLVMLQLYHNDLYSNVSIAVSRIPAFIVGVLIGKAVYEKLTVPKRHIWIMLVLAIVIAWPLQMITRKIVGVYSLAFLNYALTLLFVMILVRLSSCRSGILVMMHNLIAGTLGWFGKYTLELYLIHVMVRKIMKRLGYPTYRLLYEGILIVLSIVLSVLLNRVAGYLQKRVKV